MLAIGALLAVTASEAASRSTPYVSVHAASAGRVTITLAGHAPRGRVDFVLDGHRVRRTRDRSITVFLPRRGTDRRRLDPAWHQIAVRRTGAKGVLARARFALGASSSRRAPTLVLLAAPPADSSGTTAVLNFNATTRKLSCRLDGQPFKACKSPASYSNLKPGRHTFVVRALRGKRRSSITVTTTIPAPPLPGPPNPPGRKLVFQDDFNGNAVNGAAWSLYDSPGHAGNGLRRPSAFTTDGQGHLVITAQTIDGKIVSGGMANRINQTYGLYEFRVRTDHDPTGTMSGVVLTWPQSGRWPQDGENDIYETGDHASRSPFGSFLHFGQHNEQRSHFHNADAAQWHTMAMDWGPRAIRVYRDGELAWTVTDPAAIPRVAHHLCVQLDAFANRQLTTPVRMYVDYVRIYR